MDHYKICIFFTASPILPREPVRPSDSRSAHGPTVRVPTAQLAQ